MSFIGIKKNRFFIYTHPLLDEKWVHFAVEICISDLKIMLGWGIMEKMY